MLFLWTRLFETNGILSSSTSVFRLKRLVTILCGMTIAWSTIRLVSILDLGIAGAMMFWAPVCFSRMGCMHMVCLLKIQRFIHFHNSDKDLTLPQISWTIRIRPEHSTLTVSAGLRTMIARPMGTRWLIHTIEGEGNAPPRASVWMNWWRQEVGISSKWKNTSCPSGKLPHRIQKFWATRPPV